MREEEILRVLANAVRALTLQQVARGWWSDTRWGRSRAHAAMRHLAERRLVVLRRVLARPVESLKAPIVTWQLADAMPDFDAIAKLLHRRSNVDTELTTIVFATPRAVSLLGEGKRPTIKLTQMTHDLHVAEIFLHFRNSGYALECWLSEDRLPRDWPIRERPDAVLCDASGYLNRAIEYGGDYPASRLLQLHVGLSSIGMSYEIW